MASIYKHLGQLKVSEEFYKKSLDIVLKNNWNYYLPTIYMNLADLYKKTKNYYFALNYYIKSETLYKKNSDIRDLFSLYTNMAETYDKMGYPRNAYGMLLKATLIRNYIKNIDIEDLKNYYKTLSEIEYKLGKTDSAYIHLQKSEIYNDSIFNKTKIRYVYEMEYKYQTISKNKLIKDLEKINLLTKEILSRKEAQQKAQHKITILLIIIVLLLILSTTIILKNLLKNKRINRLLKIQNQKVIKAQEKLQKVINSLPDVFFETDEQGKIIYTNNKFYEKTGIETNSDNDIFLCDIIKDEYKEKLKSTIKKLEVDGKMENIEFEIEKKSGQTYWAIMSINAKIIDGKKELYGMIMDISEKKKIEQDLILLKTSVEQSEAGVMITDANAKIVYVNKAYSKIVGYRIEELIGKTPKIFNSGKTSQKTIKQLWTKIKAGETWRGTFINKNKNGDLFYEKSIITPIKDSKGNITHYIANKEDITDEIKKNETILKLYTATEQSPTAVLILDENFNISYANKAFERITGYKAEEIKDKSIFSLNNKSFSSKNNILSETIKKGRIWNGIINDKRKNGEKFWAETIIIPLKNEDKKIVGYVYSASDITKRVEIEEELNQTMEILNNKNKEMMASLRYAKRIQMALMSNKSSFFNFFPESFIIFFPKEIISGDFFWTFKTQNKAFVALVDCTGHGVPGAFLSIVGVTLLESAFKEAKLLSPAKVLNYMSLKLKKILSNPFSKDEVKDDMEVILTVFDYNNNSISFASSRNRIYIVTQNSHKTSNKIELLFSNNDKKLYSIKGDREFIVTKSNNFSFSEINLNLKTDDLIYYSTDGFYDQFGTIGKKYKRKNFEKLLFDISGLTLIEQENILIKSFFEFKGNVEQTDDVSVIGIKYKNQPEQ
jgi:PAS domain S-box-containing protein